MSSTDQWFVCEKGHIHWGANGAAGLLLRHVSPDGEVSFLLQQRSSLVEEAGKWGIPGGAIRESESPEEAARREAEEEIGPPGRYRITGIDVQDCGGGWKFYVVKADVGSQFPAFSVQETDATGWFTREEMQHLRLHSGLQQWLDEQEAALDQKKPW